MLTREILDVLHARLGQCVTLVTETGYDPSIFPNKFLDGQRTRPRGLRCTLERAWVTVGRIHVLHRPYRASLRQSLWIPLDGPLALWDNSTVEFDQTVPGRTRGGAVVFRYARNVQTAVALAHPPPTVFLGRGETPATLGATDWETGERWDFDPTEPCWIAWPGGLADREVTARAFCDRESAERHVRRLVRPTHLGVAHVQCRERVDAAGVETWAEPLALTVHAGDMETDALQPGGAR